MGAEYNEFFASFVLNHFFPLLLGFLRLFPRRFAAQIPPDLEACRVAEVRWLQEAFDAQVRQFPRYSVTAGLLRPLIEAA